jgi:hypothetical protein
MNHFFPQWYIFLTRHFTILEKFVRPILTVTETETETEAKFPFRTVFAYLTGRKLKLSLIFLL